MGPIQSSINNLIYQTALIGSIANKNVSSSEKEKNNQAIKKNKKQKDQKTAATKATTKANEEIQAKYMQKSNFKDRHDQAIQRRKDITEPHKPLPKKEE